MARKILVVDDEPNVLRLIGLALEREGHKVVTATDGMGALHKVRAERPDLCILDLMLPDMSGVDLCRTIRNMPEAAGMPILVLSARTQVADKVKALEAGADEYITKPVESAEMVARVSAILKFSERVRRNHSPRSGKTIAFIGAKGGVGTTSVALNTAAILAQGERTVVAGEWRGHAGSFAQHLKQVPAHNLSSLLRIDASQIDERELRTCLCGSVFRMRVLFGPQQVDEFGEIDADRAEAILSCLSRMADFTVLDLPSYPNVATQAALRRCSFVGVVLEPDPTCVAAAVTTLEMLRGWNIAGPLVGAVVVNRSPLTMPLGLADVKSQLDCGIVGVIAPAVDISISAQGRGTPLAILKPDHMASMSLSQMADRLIADTVVGMRI